MIVRAAAPTDRGRLVSLFLRVASSPLAEDGGAMPGFIDAIVFLEHGRNSIWLPATAASRSISIFLEGQRGFYYFILTDEYGVRVAAYCYSAAHGNESGHAPTVCILSKLRQPTVFLSAAAHLVSLAQHGGNVGRALRYLLELRNLQRPPLNVALRLSNVRDGAELVVHSDDACDGVLLWEAFVALGLHAALELWTALLLERPVLLLSDTTPLLAAACDALIALLSPLRWEGTYVPILPSTLLGYVEAPSPFLIGANRSAFRGESASLDTSAVVVFDLDTGELIMPSYSAEFPAPPPLPADADTILAPLVPAMQRSRGCGALYVLQGTSDSEGGGASSGKVGRGGFEVARRCFVKLLGALVRPLDLVSAIGAYATLPERGSALDALDINAWVAAGESDAGASAAQTVFAAALKGTIAFECLAADLLRMRATDRATYIAKAFAVTHPACRLAIDVEPRNAAAKADDPAGVAANAAPAALQGVEGPPLAYEQSKLARVSLRVRQHPLASIATDAAGESLLVAAGMPSVEVEKHTLESLRLAFERVRDEELAEVTGESQGSQEGTHSGDTIGSTAGRARDEDSASTTLASAMRHLIDNAKEAAAEQEFDWWPIDGELAHLEAMYAEREPSEPAPAPDTATRPENTDHATDDGVGRVAEAEATPETIAIEAATDETEVVLTIDHDRAPEGSDETEGTPTADGGATATSAPRATAAGSIKPRALLTTSVLNAPPSDGFTDLTSASLGAVELSADLVRAMAGVFTAYAHTRTDAAGRDDGSPQTASAASVLTLPSIGRAELLQLQSTDAFRAVAARTSLLSGVDVAGLDGPSRLSFWLNVYNLMCMHGFAAYAPSLPIPPAGAASTSPAPASTSASTSSSWSGALRVLRLHSKIIYSVGGVSLSAIEVEHALLRGSRPRPSFFGARLLLPKFRPSDPRMQLAPPFDPLVTFGLASGLVFAPPVRVYDDPSAVQAQLEENTRLVLAEAAGLLHDEAAVAAPKLRVALPTLLMWHMGDFGGELSQALRALREYLPETLRASLECDPPVEARYARQANWHVRFRLPPPPPPPKAAGSVFTVPSPFGRPSTG